MIAPIYFNWPGKIWVISDFHFGDTGILKYERTQFKTVEEHNSHIINTVNRTLHPGDTLVVLGDLGHNWKDEIGKIKSSYKVLILGNHDNLSKKEYSNYFDEVYSGPLFVNKFMVLSHEPIPVENYFINVHGHLHSSYLDEENYVNLSAHMCNYTPVALDKIYEKVCKLDKIRAKFLKEWYADKYVFTEGTRGDVFIYKDTLHIIPKNIVDTIKDMFIEFGAVKGNIEERYNFFESFDAHAVNILSTDSVSEIFDKLNAEFNSFLLKKEEKDGI